MANYCKNGKFLVSSRDSSEQLRYNTTDNHLKNMGRSRKIRSSLKLISTVNVLYSRCTLGAKILQPPVKKFIGPVEFSKCIFGASCSKYCLENIKMSSAKRKKYERTTSGCARVPHSAPQQLLVVAGFINLFISTAPSLYTVHLILL